jgi:hypothetical protein
MVQEKLIFWGDEDKNYKTFEAELDSFIKN